MMEFNKVDRLTSKAHDGDVEAQVNLGMLYMSGSGVARDPQKAYGYYVMAAKKNHPEALYLVGECQDCGSGTEINPVNALLNFNKGAKLGNLKSIICLADYYETGRAGIVDYEKARQLLKMAIAKGSDTSKKALASLEQKIKSLPAAAPKSGLAAPAPKVVPKEEPKPKEVSINEISFFTGLGGVEMLEVMGQLRTVTGKRGQYLFYEGDQPNGLFIISTGSCIVSINNVQTNSYEDIRTIYPGDYVGEFGLIDQLPRSASVIVEKDVKLLFLPTSVFQSLMMRHKNLGDLVVNNLVKFIRDENVLIKDPEVKGLVNSISKIPGTKENLALLVGVLRAHNVNKGFFTTNSDAATRTWIK